jgi:two-component system sensor histidine kinase MtrB
MSTSTARPWPARAVRRMARAARRFAALWRRSLQLRVVTVTLLLSILVVGLLGPLVLAKVRDGLVAAKKETSIAQATAGFNAAQAELLREAQSSGGPTTGGAVPTYDTSTLMSSLLPSLCAGGGGQSQFQAIMLPQNVPQDSEDFPRACGETDSLGLLPSSIPTQLQRAVQDAADSASPGVHYAATTLDYGTRLGNVLQTKRGLIYGTEIQVPSLNISVQLYYAFPFTQEQATLNLVERWLTLAGGFLVLALGVIAWVVTRQVVTPVRMAARISERLAAGQLEERMRVRGEDDLARLASSFNKMATHLQSQIRRLEDLSRVQRRFVSDVSHELRTPLTTVRMAADLLYEARQDFDPVVSRSAELLQAQLDRFEELLTDLLEISRFDAGAAMLEAEPVDLRDLVVRVTDGAAPLAERKGSELLVRTPDEPCIAEVDGRRIERVLRNLVVNAVEHGEGRDVVVRIEASDDAVAVAVRDYGVGLKPGEASLVFNRFWRADPARARTTGGTGLGLAIALEDARLHHGWLQAWGEPGGGSQFRLVVPRVVGTDLRWSPLPLEPEDSQHQQRLRARAAAAERLAANGGGRPTTLGANPGPPTPSSTRELS